MYKYRATITEVYDGDTVTAEIDLGFNIKFTEKLRFPEVLKYSKPTKDDITRYKAGCIDGQFTGFIPCVEHAKQIMNGKITLSSLIKDRNKDFPPFPIFH